MRTVRVAVADPSKLVLDVAIASLHAGDCEVVADATTLAGLVDICDKEKPDVAVAASSFSDGKLVEGLNRILRHATRVLVLCSSAAAEDAPSLLLGGASGYLYVSHTGFDELPRATRAVAAGETTLHPAAAEAVLVQWRAYRDAVQQPRQVTSTLTGRETQVLEALVSGASTKAIAKSLALSPKTVEAHKSRIYTKLGARNHAQVIGIAREKGLMPSPGE